MTIDKYKDETRVRNLALQYIEDGKQETLGSFYEALVYLSKGLYLKYAKRDKQVDFDEDIMHDSCVICVENLKKGTVAANSGWSKYLIQVLRNRSKATNPLHLAYFRRERGTASNRVKLRLAKSLSFPAVKGGETTIAAVLADIDNIAVYADEVCISGEADETLRSFIRGYFEDQSHLLPFKNKAILSLFLYYSITSLFEISMENVVYHGKSGFCKRYRFMSSCSRNKFKEMLKEYVRE